MKLYELQQSMAVSASTELTKEVEQYLASGYYFINNNGIEELICLKKNTSFFDKWNTVYFVLNKKYKNGYAKVH